MSGIQLQAWLPWAVLVIGPIVLIGTTCFAKISVLLAALRLGLGAEQLLPWTVMTTLALLLTGVIMQPVAASMLESVSSIDWGSTVPLGLEPLRKIFAPLLEFCARHADTTEIELVASVRNSDPSQPHVLVTGFLLTELREALVMAAYVLVPFIVVELALAQVVTAAALPEKTATTLAIPLKIGLFLAIGGWTALLEVIAEGYT